MKKILMATGIMLVSAFCLFDGYAAEKETVDWDKIAKLGNGVYREKRDERGNIKSFVAVGTATIHKTLGVANGKRIAQKRARLQAKAEIVKYLKGKIITYDASTGENIISLTGNGNNVSKSGKQVEKDIAKNEEYAEGIVRGATTLYTATQKTNNDLEFVIILGWSSQSVKNAKQAQAIMEDESPVKNTSENKVKTSAAEDRLETKTIEKTISDEAADY